MKRPKHPMQPVEMVDRVLRFKHNAIVDFLAKNRLNELRAMGVFSQEDWQQLAQLIGYSVSGYCDLSFVSEKSKRKARKRAKRRA